MTLSPEQQAAFLERIGLSWEAVRCRKPDSALLKLLCIACETTMPFENLDLLSGKLLSLEDEDLYEKMVVRHRGGNCFELNGLCGVLLRSLGFGVSDYLSRFFRDANGKIPMRRHRLLKVETLDGTFLWDIGIGQRSPVYPLRLAEGVVQEQQGVSYRFEKDPFYGWLLSDWYHGEWQRLLSFTEEPQATVDFVTPCVWCELHPDSPFHRQRMIAIKTANGRKTIDGSTFKEFVGEKLVTIQELTDEEIPLYLEEHFGLRV